MERRNQSSWTAVSAHNIALLTFEVLGIKASACSNSHVAASPPLKATIVLCLTDQTFCRPSDSCDGSAPQPEKECMLALLAVQRIVFVIKIQNVLFSLKSKFLVEQHSRVACRDVKGYVFAHAGLPREGEKEKKKKSQRE